MADAPDGQTVTDTGTLVIADRASAIKPAYVILVWTDIGWKVLPAVLSKGVDAAAYLGRTSRMTARIQRNALGERQIIVLKIEKQ